MVFKGAKYYLPCFCCYFFLSVFLGVIVDGDSFVMLNSKNIVVSFKRTY